jgi:hypothetical protein
VICTRGNAVEARQVMREMMEKLKLTVNEKKTRRATLPEDAFAFLGTRSVVNTHGGRARQAGPTLVHVRPSRRYAGCVATSAS